MVSFFALACFYAILSILGIVRYCQVPGGPKDDTGILRWFYVMLTLTSAMRLTGFAFCSAGYALAKEDFIDQNHLNQIRELH